MEADLLAEIWPHCAVGGYLSVGWDWFQGQSNVDMLSGQIASFNKMDMTTVIVGAKVLERVGPFITWEGRIGGGYVRYSQLTYTDVSAPPPLPGLQYFRPISRGVFEIGGRVAFGDRHVCFDLGLGLRAMGAMSPGTDYSGFTPPEFFFTYMFEVGLTLRW